MPKKKEEIVYFITSKWMVALRNNKMFKTSFDVSFLKMFHPQFAPPRLPPTPEHHLFGSGINSIPCLKIEKHI